MTQDELKQAVAKAAVDHIAPHLEPSSIVGVGTGSTANFFIEENLERRRLKCKYWTSVLARLALPS